MPFIQEATVPDGGGAIGQYMLGFSDGANVVSRDNTMGNEEFDLILEDQAVGRSNTLIKIVIVAVGDEFYFIHVITDFQAALGIDHGYYGFIPSHDLVAQAVGQIAD